MRKDSEINVTLKAAISLDGKIATALGESKWISGKKSRKKVQELRAKHDAILVGINTILVDDPQLNVRGILKGNSPIRVVLDSKARIPNQSKVFKNDGVPVIIITGNQAPRKIWPKLSCLKIIEAPSEIPKIKWVLNELNKIGINNLLVEGGGIIHASFLKSKCVNKIVLFLAPKIIGGQNALTWCSNLNIENLEESLKAEIISVNKLEEDWLILAKLK